MGGMIKQQSQTGTGISLLFTAISWLQPYKFWRLFLFFNGFERDLVKSKCRPHGEV